MSKLGIYIPFMIEWHRHRVHYIWHPSINAHADQVLALQQWLEYQTAAVATIHYL